jgi:hypothetical protein
MLKTWFVVGILRFQKWFVVDILDFEFEFCCRYFSIFFSFEPFGLLFQKIGIFFQKLLVTLGIEDKFRRNRKKLARLKKADRNGKNPRTLRT